MFEAIFYLLKSLYLNQYWITDKQRQMINYSDFK